MNLMGWGEGLGSRDSPQLIKIFFLQEIFPNRSCFLLEAFVSVRTSEHVDNMTTNYLPWKISGKTLLHMARQHDLQNNSLGKV